MKLKEVMSTDVEMVPADASLKDAAEKMKSGDIGALPVWDGKEIVGMLTDRDITVRVTAEGKDPEAAKVRDAMTPQVMYVYEDQDVDEASKLMKDKQIRRLAVFNREDKMVGMFSLGDLATDSDPGQAGQTLGGVSEPSDGPRG